MKRYLIYICISLGFLFTGCEKSDEYVASPQENFEALWKILDENYCFFEYKDINWNEVHDRYKTQISDTMNQYVLFDVLGDMLNELKDGHTNLISSFLFLLFHLRQALLNLIHHLLIFRQLVFFFLDFCLRRLA